MTCGKKCEVYSRVTGYLRPVRNWNDGKREEFKRREMFSIEPFLSEKMSIEI